MSDAPFTPAQEARIEAIVVDRVAQILAGSDARIRESITSALNDRFPEPTAEQLARRSRIIATAQGIIDDVDAREASNIVDRAATQHDRAPGSMEWKR